MFDSRDVVDEVRQRINILEVISEYVSLKRSGRSFKGLCPFHAEKTPSFTVSDEFQSWHCFGCGEHGDVFSFLMKIENLTFPEALERLATRVGIDINATKGLPASKKERLRRINSAAAEYFSAMLKKSQMAQRYLQSRGIAHETILQFGIGFASSEWDGLLRYFQGNRVNTKDAIDAGLIIKSDKNRRLYDRFRNRIIFPIYDIQSKVAGFGGRSIGDEMPKYMNSPETELFNKSNMLYGLNFARKKIAEEGFVIIVEGYMDVITAHQAGFTNCVATMGTALTPNHISLLSRYTNKVVLAFDSDSAGMKAALRSAAMFSKSECDVRLARLPKGDDPDSLIRSGRSADFIKVIETALPLIDFKLSSLKEKYNTSTTEGRAALLKEAAHIIADVELFVDRERYIKEIIKYHPNPDIGSTVAQNQVRADIESIIARRNKKVLNVSASPNTIKSAVPSALDKAENMILKALITGCGNPKVITDALTPDYFSRDVSRSAAKLIFDRYTDNRSLIFLDLLEDADKQTAQFLSELVMKDDGPPLTERALQDCVETIKKSRSRLKTSEILAPYINEGSIEINEDYKEQALQKLRTILKESGKLPNTGGSKGV